uniref:Uncharacterized protein LOC117367395 n=1 Tax=Geotrypetes seraphini TaxID=260995 RepID=A0A6P8SB18_GEOSA|nr:uncharacterized protein LOC117367395 [Geotrypetes seraphini]
MMSPNRSMFSYGLPLRRPYSAIPVINREYTVQDKNLQFTVNGESCSLQERPNSRTSFCPSSKPRRRLMQEGPETQREKKRERFVQETPQETKRNGKPKNCDDFMDDSYSEVCGRPPTPEPWAVKLSHRPSPSKNVSIPRALHLYLPNLSPEDEERKPNKRSNLIKNTRDTGLGGNSGRSQQEGCGVTPLFQHISGPGVNLEMRMNGNKVKLEQKKPESKKLLSRPGSAKEKHLASRPVLPTSTFMFHVMSPDTHVWSPAAYSVRGSSILNKEEQAPGLEELLKESDDIIRQYQSDNRRLIRNEAYSINTKNNFKFKMFESGSDEPPNTRMISEIQNDHFNDHGLWPLLYLGQ